MEKDFILHTSIALRVGSFGFVFHFATIVMVPSIASRTFKQLINRFEFEASNTPLNVV